MQEEENSGILWWWTTVFAALLLLARWDARCMTALGAATIKWPLSFLFIQLAKRRIAEQGGEPSGHAIQQPQPILPDPKS